MAKTPVTIRAAWIGGICAIIAAVIGIVVVFFPNSDKDFKKEKAYDVYQKMAQYHREIKIAANGYHRNFPTNYEELKNKGLATEKIVSELESLAHRSVTVDCHNLIPELNLLFPRKNENYWKDKIYYSYGVFERVMQTVNIDYLEDQNINQIDEVNAKVDSLDIQLTAIVVELKSDLDKMK